MNKLCTHCRTGSMKKPEDGHPSYLLCSNCGAIQLCYTPQDYQAKLHTIPYKTLHTGQLAVQIVGVFGGYGSAKSRASLEEVVVRALENPHGTGLLTAPTLQQLKRTSIKTLLQEVLPPILIEYYNKTDGEIRLINGFTFYTIPSDDEEKLRSINAGIIHMEEASGIKRSIYDQLLTRMRDPFVRNRLFVVCSNPDLGWIRDVFVNNEARRSPIHPEHTDFNPYVSCFIWETKLNKYLPPDFIEMNSKGKPEWWIKRFLEGSFDHSDGMVYPNIAKTFRSSDYLDKYKHLYKPQELDRHGVPKIFERFITLDHGIRNPTAVYWHAIDPKEGVVITYNEYYVTNTVVPKHAETLKPLIEEVPAGKLWFMVADPSTRNKTDPVEGKSVQGLYQEYDIFWSMGNNNLDAGILRVNSYIERGKWIILTDRCPNLAKEAIAYKYPEVTMDELDKNLDEKPVKAHDHGMDSCFIAGTWIETDKGQVPIESVSVGDKVLTRQGYKSVIDWGITNGNAEVYTVLLSNGRVLTGTKNHPVWIEGKGFCAIDSLRYGDIVNISPNWGNEPWQKSTSLNGTERNGVDIPNRSMPVTDDTTKTMQLGYTEQYGSIITNLFQKVIMSIIRMKTQQTTTSVISNSSKVRNIWSTMHGKITSRLHLSRMLQHTERLSMNELHLGINQKKGVSGIKNMPKVLFLNTLNQLKHLFVSNVRQHLSHQWMPSFALTSVSLNGVGTTDSMTLNISAGTAEKSSWQTSTTKNDIVPVHVVSVHIEAQKQVVYNLSVNETPEYYANGVLVHNCRYGFMRLPDDPDLLKTIAYEPDRHYNTSNNSFNEYGFNPNEEDWESHSERDWTSYV